VTASPSHTVSDDVAFTIRDTTLVTQATGLRVQNLREFRHALTQVPPGSIYHHFWGRFLRPQFAEPEYNNDFASWSWHALHERALAERLSMANPADFSSFRELREELVEIVESRLDEGELVPWARADQQFYFLQSQIIVFDTGLSVRTPPEMGDAISHLSAGSIFYHFIDARRRTPEHADDFSCWIMDQGPEWLPLAEAVQAIDPYFSSLPDLRRDLCTVFEQHLQDKEA